MQLKKLLILLTFLCALVKVYAQQSPVSSLHSDSTRSQEIDSIALSHIVDLNAVRVKGTRHHVRQTLNGYEYFPEKDSAYRNGSLFLALQRLPFVNVSETRLDYKEGKKIWFRINGKDRKGIGDNWKEVLQSLPAKSIHKVELVTDIPVLIKNQGYDVLINIITLEIGVRGKAFNVAGIIDSRRNFNHDAGATFLKRKNDFAFKIAARDQGYESFKRTEVFKDGVLKSQNLLANNYYYSRWHAGVSWGFRPDSLRDFSTSLNFVRVNRNDRWTNLFNHPSTLNDFTNTFVQLSGSIDLSYVQRKKKYERSFVFAGRSGHEDFNNRIGHTGNKNFDSLNNISTTRSHLGIFEFNQITRRKNPGVEFGGQAYVKVLQTEYSFV